MDSIFLYSIISLLVGVGVTALLLHSLVIKKYKVLETDLKDQNRIKENELIDERKTREQLNSELIATKSDLNHTHTRLLEQKEELENLNLKLSKDFENIANKVVYHNSKVMQEKHEEKLMAMLNPFKDKIENFERKVDETHKENIKENQSLKEQINHLKDLNKSMSDEARNLTSALKGDKKLQGDWGEHKLERILQAAGLEKEIHYRKQVNLKDENNNNFRPDYIIYLPDDKNLIVDSKVSLVAYERFYNSENLDDGKQQIALHVKAIKDHITSLSNTNYSELLGINSPDYVIMYMPIEAALGLAMTEDTGLFEFALSKNIVLVSNNTLLATLKTVSFIWRQDMQNKNAIEIARQGGALYDKFVGFVETLIGVGKKMNDAKDGYDKAMNQLTDGTGNLVRRTEQLKKLGIKTSKALPEKLIDRSE
ncbi:MAG: DNA recombination protein RmuC [Bacteroidia bacterium]|nr:DNA recombination protein RmuC [Bacteroidia bacterium]